MPSNNSLILSEKVEANLNDAMANLKLLERELASRNTPMEVEKLQLQAEKDELEAAKLELQADRAEFKAEKLEFEANRASSRPDPKLESEKEALKAERLQLEAEKTQLRVAQVQLKAAQSQLEDAKSQLELAQAQLDEAKIQLETARTHLEAAKAEAAVDSKRLEAAKASLEAAKARFLAATKQLNAAKSRFEAAKTLLDAAAAKEHDHSANLQIRVTKLEAEKLISETAISLLEKDKLNLTAQVESLVIKVREVEEKLDQCCKDKKTLQDEKAKPDKGVKPKVFLDIAINNTAAGRIVIELDVDTTPLTAENFRALCTGEKGIGKSGKPLHYKGSKFYSILHGKYVLGGDIVGNTNGGDSIYGPTFPPENLTKKHDGPGTVSMVFQTGTNPLVMNGSQFFIATAKVEEFNSTNVVFGHVVDGMNVVMEMEKAGNNASVIAGCGQLP